MYILDQICPYFIWPCTGLTAMITAEWLASPDCLLPYKFRMYLAPYIIMEQLFNAGHLRPYKCRSHLRYHCNRWLLQDQFGTIVRWWQVFSTFLFYFPSKRLVLLILNNCGKQVRRRQRQNIPDFFPFCKVISISSTEGHFFAELIVRISY